MKIKSVTRKVIITINGKDYVRQEEDWTESILDAQKDDCIENNEDIFDWIEVN